jgi:hypothetical protein
LIVPPRLAASPAGAPGRDRAFALGALIVFTISLAIIGSRHEPWFDEAQAWLIARDEGLTDLFTRGVRFEGTPALWHLLLFIVQRLGLPYGGMWVVSAALAASGAFIVLFKSPFPLALRLGVVFSYFFAYQYAVVARSYALDLLFVPLLATLYPQRLDRPFLYLGLLALAANTNAHSFVLAAVLALDAAYAGRTRLLRAEPTLMGAFALYGAASAAAALQAYPPPDVNFMIRKPGDVSVLHALQLGAEAFVERWDILSTAPPSPLSRGIGGVITLLILAPALRLFAKAGVLLLALGLFGGLIGFSALKYGNAWHAGIIFLAFVFLLWISWGRVCDLSPRARIALNLALSAMFMVQVWSSAAAAARDLVEVYSPAAEMAALLAGPDGRGPHGRVGVLGFKGFAVQPYFHANIFANYEGGRAKPAYYLWRKGERPIPGVSEKEWKGTAAQGYETLLLSGFNLMGPNGPFRYIADARAAGYCPVAALPGALIWKTYVLETDEMMLFRRCSAAKAP